MGVVIRQSIRGTIINYIGASIGAFTTLFIVTKLNKEVYGLSQVLWAAGLVFMGIAQLGINSSAIRFFPQFKDPEKKNNGFFFYLIMIPLVGFLLFIPVFFLIKPAVINLYIKQSPLFVDYYNWLIPLTFFLIYWVVFETYANVLMRIAVPKFIREILVRVLLAVLYLLYILQLVDLNQFITGFVLVYAIAMMACFFYTSKIGTISLSHNYSFINQSLKKDFVNYSSWLILGSLGTSVVQYIDTLMVSAKLGLDYTAVYQIAFFMAAVIDIPSRSISAIATPLAAEALTRKDSQEANQLYKKVALHQFLIGGLFFMLIWINIDNIYNIIPNGEEYQAGKWVVFFLGISKILQISLGFGGQLISFSKYYRWSLIFILFLTIITIYFNHLLIPKFGLTGAAIATALAFILNLSLQQWLVSIKMKSNPYSKGMVKVIALLALAFTISYLLPTLTNPWFDGIYRTAIVGIPTLIAIYFSRISPEVDSLMRKLYNFAINKK